MNPKSALPDGVLKQILAEQVCYDADGNAHSLRDGILPLYAEALYRVVRDRRPKKALEVGMAHGVSTLAILTAMAEYGGTLISIDPNQTTGFMGVGLANVEKAGFSDSHRLVEEKDFFALPALVEEGVRIEFAFIDGWHTFDYTLLDFFYVDKMLDAGGAVGFNDCGYRAVHKVLRFVESHRRYREIDVGLPRDFTGPRGLLSKALRRVQGRSAADRYYEKRQDWEPNWNFYAHF